MHLVRREEEARASRVVSEVDDDDGSRAIDFVDSGDDVAAAIKRLRLESQKEDCVTECGRWKEMKKLISLWFRPVSFSDPWVGWSGEESGAGNQQTIN